MIRAARLVSENNMRAALRHFKNFLLHCSKKPIKPLLFQCFFPDIFARRVADRRVSACSRHPRLHLFARFL